MEKHKKIKAILKRDCSFSVREGTFHFDGDKVATHMSKKGVLERLKMALKRYGRLYYLLLDILGPVTDLPVRNKINRLVTQFDHNTIILNVGSGPNRFNGRDDIINLDIHNYEETDLLSDAADIPIRDNMADLIINVAMLEHVSEPERIVKEMRRILKPGGLLVAYVPFMVPQHDAPDDFTRWTRKGADRLFSDFSHRRIIVGCGPTSAMLYVLEEWLAIAFSFNLRFLHDIIFIFCAIVLFPLKYLDIFLSHFDTAPATASGFYVTAIKKETT